jgi:hypothetical protein
MNIKVKEREVVEFFLDVPDIKQFPEYYKKIKNPISFEMIKYKIQGYKFFREYELDIELLCKNAQKYNRSNSRIYKDSVLIHVKN